MASPAPPLKTLDQTWSLSRRQSPAAAAPAAPPRSLCWRILEVMDQRRPRRRQRRSRSRVRERRSAAPTPSSPPSTSRCCRRNTTPTTFASSRWRRRPQGPREAATSTCRPGRRGNSGHIRPSINSSCHNSITWCSSSLASWLCPQPEVRGQRPASPGLLWCTPRHPLTLPSGPQVHPSHIWRGPGHNTAGTAAAPPTETTCVPQTWPDDPQCRRSVWQYYSKFVLTVTNKVILLQLWGIKDKWFSVFSVISRKKKVKHVCVKMKNWKESEWKETDFEIVSIVDLLQQCFMNKWINLNNPKGFWVNKYENVVVMSNI